jgi:hypothetical protein
MNNMHLQQDILLFLYMRYAYAHYNPLIHNFPLILLAN